MSEIVLRFKLTTEMSEELLHIIWILDPILAMARAAGISTVK